MRRKIERRLLEWKSSLLEWLGQNHFKSWVRVNLAQNASMVQRKKRVFLDKSAVGIAMTDHETD